MAKKKTKQTRNRCQDLSIFLMLSFESEQHDRLALLPSSRGTLGRLFKVPDLSPPTCKMGIFENSH